ncbi:MAG: MgtC/SapB family protein [Bacteroidales bacterium]|nr:MgtC/SapB family protein [Bacteroidales bacterium]
MTLDFILRIFVAGLLGGAIGLERGLRAKEAGLRTHFLVALGSAMFMIISQYAFEGRTHDAARVAAQVVSGIGFIGAGVIIFQRNVIRGVTTAAGLWVAAAIGLACGSGLYVLAAAASVLSIVCLEAMHFISRRLGEKEITVTLNSVDHKSMLETIEELRKNHIDVASYSMNGGKVNIVMRVRQNQYMEKIYLLLSNIEGVSVESIE